MGMYLHLVGVPGEDVRRYAQSPALVEAASARALRAATQRIVERQPAPDVFNLDKRGHFFHDLFTGHGWMRGDIPEGALFAGKEVGPDRGYGRARLLGPEDTVKFATFLQCLTVERLIARIDFAAMRREKIYAYDAYQGSAGDLEECEWDVRDFFPPLRDFVQAQAAQGRALLVVTW